MVRGRTDEKFREMIENPRYYIYLNGKEVKKLPFYEQAIKYATKRNGESLFGFNLCEVVDTETGAIVYPNS